MEKIRKPFQGVLNIVRFNWHFYIISLISSILLFIIGAYISMPWQWGLYLVAGVIPVVNIISLGVSYYVYDRSGLYHFDWLKEHQTAIKVVNISAGFDETTAILKDRFPKAAMMTMDFYDPSKHTEVSIKRARKAYPLFPGTRQVKTENLPVADDSADMIFVIFSAHEIRNEAERIQFFKELRRIVKADGQIFIVEHLRDTVNFLAYNIGFFHFYSQLTWHKTFHAAQLKLHKEMKITPFISTFILEKNGNTL